MDPSGSPEKIKLVAMNKDDLTPLLAAQSNKTSFLSSFSSGSATDSGETFPEKHVHLTYEDDDTKVKDKQMGVETKILQSSDHDQDEARKFSRKTAGSIYSVSIASSQLLIIGDIMLSQDAIVNQNTPQTKKKKGFKRFLGMGLMLAATACFSSAVVFVTFLQSKNYHVFSLVLWRFLGGCFIPSLPIIIYYQVFKESQLFGTMCPLYLRKARLIGEGDGLKTNNCQTEKLQLFILLTTRGCLGVASAVFFYFSLNFIAPADATVITFSTPVFVIFLARIVLQEKFGVMSIVAALITLFGVLIVAHPPFITGGVLDSNVMTGVGLALGGMISNTIIFVLLRLLHGVHYAVITCAQGIIGVVLCSLLCVIVDVFEVPRSLEDCGFVVGLSITTFGGQVFATLAFKYEDAGPLAVLRGSDVLFQFVLQLIFFNKQPDKYSLIGSTIVLFGVVLTGVRKHVSTLPEEDRCRRVCRFILI